MFHVGKCYACVCPVHACSLCLSLPISHLHKEDSALKTQPIDYLLLLPTPCLLVLFFLPGFPSGFTAHLKMLAPLSHHPLHLPRGVHRSLLWGLYKALGVLLTVTPVLWLAGPSSSDRLFLQLRTTLIFTSLSQ